MTIGLVDAHVHVWDPARHDYPWLNGTDLRRPMLPAQIDRADGAATGMVFVQAGAAPHDALAEATWVARSDWPELIAIVADADLRAAAKLGPHLDALAELPRVVGVRDLLQDDSTDSFAERADGLRIIAERGLSFDACVRHPQLDALVALLERVPDVTVILDHLGKPPVDAGIDSPAGRRWSDAIMRVATRPGTFVKLSGLTAESSDPTAFDRNADAFVEHALTAFGPQRTMLGSDWPVSATFGIGGRFIDWVARVRRVVGERDWPEVAQASARRAYLQPDLIDRGSVGP
ncbi:amidohydrolase family protein [Agromyces intestinalis]|uniref:amidohydrolase family protein n=1 Tax=Agromyces intestinalis TaxID=2592652 RepID=UPI00143D1EA4|nr:amidohydrolase family protein [Agromyces intestinalis]